MRSIVLGAMAALAIGVGASLVGATPAAAGNYPVCQFGPYERMDCRYSTFSQCAASASGLGATCQVNPAYAGRAAYVDEPAPRPRGKRKHWYREYY